MGDRITCTQGAKPVFLDSAPWPLHLQGTHCLFPSQTELGSSPECSRHFYLLPVCPYLPHLDALLFFVPCLLLPFQDPLLVPLPQRRLVPHCRSPEPFLIAPPCPPNPCSLLHLPACECVSLTVWEFPNWGQALLPTSRPQDRLDWASVRTLKVSKLCPPNPQTSSLTPLPHLGRGIWTWGQKSKRDPCRPRNKNALLYSLQERQLRELPASILGDRLHPGAPARPGQ